MVAAISLTNEIPEKCIAATLLFINSGLRLWGRMNLKTR